VLGRAALASFVTRERRLSALRRRRVHRVARRGARGAPPVSFSGRKAFVRASAGIALVEGTYENPEDILRDADIAMYRAKAGGRDRCQIFHAALRDAAIGGPTWKQIFVSPSSGASLRSSINRSSRSAVERCHGFEALLRWRHPTRACSRPAHSSPSSRKPVNRPGRRAHRHGSVPAVCAYGKSASAATTR
jgi:predicted signal transduction protein with EAL and GGDEF domain